MVLHGSATTTHAVRAAIQRSQAPTEQLSQTYGINSKTVLKWKKRICLEDRKTGPSEPRSKVLTEAEEEAIIVLWRQALFAAERLKHSLKCSFGSDENAR